jgi:hypothetical protein
MNATSGIELVAALKTITTGVSSGDNQIWVPGHDFPGHICITVMMPLGRIAFYDQIFSFDVTQAA